MSGKYATETLPADAAGIARAAEVLRSGGLVAMPTETVYGLAARADDAHAVSKIYEAKGRPNFNPLIVHISSIEEMTMFTEVEREIAPWSPPYEATVGEFARGSWPGPLTLVVPRKANAPVAPQVTAGLTTIALRMPANRIARELLKLAGPLAAPSANRSGFVSPTTAEHVLASLDGRINLVLDGGPTTGGIESTILKLREDGRWEQLRAGPENTILWHPSFFAREPAASGGKIDAPGQLAQHYSPGKPVRLDAMCAEADEFMIGFGRVDGDCNLSPEGDLAQAAARLYACLHSAAAAPQTRVAVAPIPEEGIGTAINDRLRRAAA